jgi:signal peptidase II
VEPAPEPGASSRRHWLALAAVLVPVLVADQVLKAVVRTHVPYDSTTTVLGVRIHHTRNDGLLSGLVHGAAVPVGILTVGVVLVVLREYGRRRGRVTWVGRLAVGLFLGGTIGNQVDRLRLGYVTDFVARGDRNAFNFADLAIYAGLVLLVVLLVRGDRTPPAGG